MAEVTARVMSSQDLDLDIVYDDAIFVPDPEFGTPSYKILRVEANNKTGRRAKVQIYNSSLPTDKTIVSNESGKVIKDKVDLSLIPDLFAHQIDWSVNFAFVPQATRNIPDTSR